MRVYAGLLGVLLTAGSAYLAQLAVASAGFERLAAPATGRGDLGARGELWYGGVLDPITIVATRATTPAVAFGAPWTRSSECALLARPKRHAITSDTARASMGSMM